MNRLTAIALACAGALMMSGGTQAQNRPDVDPCAPSQRLQPAPADGTVQAPPTTAGDSLSEKLARTDGVLCPPSVGPDMRAPTPPGGAIQVIPPPGTPGGDPSVQPK